MFITGPGSSEITNQDEHQPGWTHIYTMYIHIHIYTYTLYVYRYTHTHHVQITENQRQSLGRSWG